MQNSFSSLIFYVSGLVTGLCAYYVLARNTVAKTFWRKISLAREDWTRQG